jgi:hypothetical protein
MKVMHQDALPAEYADIERRGLNELRAKEESVRDADLLAPIGGLLPALFMPAHPKQPDPDPDAQLPTVSGWRDNLSGGAHAKGDASEPDKEKEPKKDRSGRKRE